MQPRYNEGNTLARPATPSGSKSPAQRQESQTRDSRTTRAAKQKAVGGKPIEFSLYAPHASSVVLAGSFNNWDAQKNPLQRHGDGWKASVPLQRGRYEYRFVVDGQWISDPNCKESVRNDY